MQLEQAILIRSKTRLEQLIDRFNSKSQARFYIERSGGEFDPYVQEHDRFYLALERVTDRLNKHLRTKVIDRSFLPNFIFTPTDLIVVLGQDGLVANTAKYSLGKPMLAINPDPDRYDGQLLPHKLNGLSKTLDRIVEGKFDTDEITMAEVELNDGQRLLAFNDLFIGQKGHVSAKYIIRFNGQEETQSSSGILVSTGAGSTGWLSSVFNMTNGILRRSRDGQIPVPARDRLTSDLMFVVREPFRSRTTGADMVIGNIGADDELQVESMMEKNGVIFSDGIEADNLEFNTGAIANIRIASDKARLIV